MACPVLSYAVYLDMDDPPYPAVIVNFPDGANLSVLAQPTCSYANSGGISVDGTGLFGEGGNTLSNSGTISATGTATDAAGIWLASNGAANNSGTISASGSYAVGLGGDGNVTARNTGTVRASGLEAAGLFVDGFGSATNAATGTVTASGREAIGVGIDGTGRALNRGTITMEGSGVGAIGVSAIGSGTVAENTGTVVVSSPGGVGVGAAGPNSAASNSGTVTLSGSFDVGVTAVGDGVAAEHHGTISASGANSVGVAISGNRGTVLAIGEGGSLRVSNSVTCDGAGSAGVVAASNNATVEIAGSVTMSGRGAIGVAAFGEIINVTLGTAAELSGDDAVGFLFGTDAFFLSDLAGERAAQVTLELYDSVTLTGGGSTFVDAMGNGLMVTSFAGVSSGGSGLIAQTEEGTVRLINATTQEFNVRDTVFGVVSDAGADVILRNEAEATMTGGQLADVFGFGSLTFVNRGTMGATAATGEPVLGLRGISDRAAARALVNNEGTLAVAPDGITRDVGVDLTFLKRDGTAEILNRAAAEISATQGVSVIGAQSTNFVNRGEIRVAEGGLQAATGRDDALIEVRNLSSVGGLTAEAPGGTAIDLAIRGSGGSIAVENVRGATLDGQTGIAVAGGADIGIENQGQISAEGRGARGIEVSGADDGVTLNLLNSGKLRVDGPGARGVDVELTGEGHDGMVNLEYDPRTALELLVEGDNAVGARISAPGVDTEITGDITVLGKSVTGVRLAGSGEGSSANITSAILAQGDGSATPDNSALKISGSDHTCFVGSGVIVMPELGNLDGPQRFGRALSYEPDFLSTDDGIQLPQAHLAAQGRGAVGLASRGGGNVVVTFNNDDPDRIVGLGFASITATGAGSVGVALSDLDTLVNYGSISGGAFGIKGNAGRQAVFNSGEIDGGVALRGGRDSYFTLLSLDPVADVSGGRGFDQLVIESQLGVAGRFDPKEFSGFELVRLTGGGLVLFDEVLNTKWVEVRGNTVLALDGGTINAAVEVQEGSVLLGHGRVGAVEGGGSVIAAGGTLDIGESPGRLKILGDLALQGTALFEIEGTRTAQRDRLIVTETAVLSGAALEVALAPGLAEVPAGAPLWLARGGDLTLDLSGADARTIARNLDDIGIGYLVQDNGDKLEWIGLPDDGVAQLDLGARTAEGAFVTLHNGAGFATGGGTEGLLAQGLGLLALTRGADRVTISGAEPVEIQARGGRDVLRGARGDDVLDGGGQRDRLFGEGGNDRLLGGAGNDRLVGNRGNDRLVGAAGDDRLTGGPGRDRFIFADGHGADTITDFDALKDRENIVLRQVTAIESFADLSANHMTQVGADVRIDAGGDRITVLGVALDDMTRGDFLF